MSSPGDIKRWLRGENVKGLPDRTKIWPIPKKKTATDSAFKIIDHPSSSVVYRISDGGNDALLLFGKHRGYQLTEIVKKEPEYLEWLMDSSYGVDLKDIAGFVLEEHRSHIRATTPQIW
jgi:hypothetical protein